MAAQQVDRLCYCGCLGSIAHLSNNARYLPDCRRHLEGRRPNNLPTVLCACGCGADITRMRRGAQRTRECQRRHQDQQNAEKRRGGRLEQNEKRKRAGAHVNPGHYVHTDAPYIPTKRCQYCANIPDARTIDRVINDNALVITFVARIPPGYSDRPNLPCCVGCGEQYGDDTPIGRGSLIRSSAGTMKDAGNLYGYSAHHSYGDKSLDGRDRSGIRREKKGK